MKKFWKFLSYVLVAVAASVLTLGISSQLPSGGKLEELQWYLNTFFVDGVDNTKLEDAAANGMVSALGNRWSYYIPASEYQAHLDNQNNAYVGIGVTITAGDDGYTVTKVSEGGPSQEAGILPGDLFIKADGHSLVGLPIEEGRQYVQGEAGTQVEITVLRDGKELTFTVTRRTVQVQVATGKLLEGDIGLVTIVNFNSNCRDMTVKVIEELLAQGAKSLIFDVRNNGGGYAQEMIKLLDYLLPEGVIFRTVDYKGQESTDVSDENCLNIPMAVMVNGNSYSAAEFFAAALAEYEAAILVGEKTSGKGYFQQTFALSDGSAVAISTGKYFTPNGVHLEGVGLTPEVYVAVDEETAAQIYAGVLDPMEDPQVLAAINALKTAK